jgi:hypothetical protein
MLYLPTRIVYCLFIYHELGQQLDINTKKKKKPKHACIDISIKHKLMYT